MGIEDKILVDLNMGDIRKTQLTERFIQKSKELAAMNTNKGCREEKKVRSKHKKPKDDRLNEYKQAIKKIDTQKKEIARLKKLNYTKNSEVASLTAELNSCKESRETTLKQLEALTSSYNREKSLTDTKIKSLRSKLCSQKNKMNNQRKNLVITQNKLRRVNARVRDLTQRLIDSTVNSKGIPKKHEQELKGLESEIKKLNKSKLRIEAESELKIHKLQRIIREKNQVDTADKVNYDFGVIIENSDGELEFESTLGERYRVPNISKDMAVKVIRIDNKRVVVDKILDITPIKRTTLKVRNHSLKVVVNTDFNFKPYKVLIIGGRNKDRHIQTLTKSGLQVTWYDAFKGKEVNLEEAFSRHDIVLCCVAHSKHKYVDLVKERHEKEHQGSVKYNLINEDIERNLPRFINYIIENSNNLD